MSCQNKSSPLLDEYLWRNGAFWLVSDEKWGDNEVIKRRILISTVHSYPRDDWRGAGKNTATKWRMRKLGEISHETVFAAGGRGEKSTHGIPGMNNGQTNDLTDAFFFVSPKCRSFIFYNIFSNINATHLIFCLKREKVGQEWICLSDVVRCRRCDDSNDDYFEEKLLLYFNYS